MTRRQSSGVGSEPGGPAMPAEFTRVVRRPKRCTVASTIRAQAVASVTSISSASASPPAAVMAAAVSLAPSTT
jgi:hypothetical protein